MIVSYRTRMLIAASVIIIGIAGGVLYAFNSVYSTEEQTCLASIINKELDKLILRWPKTGPEYVAIAEQQSEIIGRVLDRTAVERKRTHCAEAISRRIAQARWNYFTGPKNEAERWQVVYAAAGRVRKGSFKYALPPNCRSVVDYKQTRLRGWDAARRNKGAESFVVANMTVYCQ